MDLWLVNWQRRVRAWYLYYPGGSTLYRLIRGGGGSGGGVGGGYLGSLRKGRGDVSDSELQLL